MRVALLVTHIRAEEKLILAAFNNRDISPDIILDRELNFNVSQGADQLAPSGIPWRNYDCIFERCVSTSRGLYALAILNSWGVRTYNSYATAALCSDKLRSSIAFFQHGIPQPYTRVAFTPESALEAIEDVKYPAVLKPVTGSWGRLLARVHNRDSAEAILEHRQTLGDYNHHVYYVQEYVDKPGSRYPGIRRRRSHYRRHLSRIQSLDHQYGARRVGIELPGNRAAKRHLLARRTGSRWRHSGYRLAGRRGRQFCRQRNQPHNGIPQ